MKRGAIVVVAARGAYTGKPRPGHVVRSDLFNPTHQSVTICPITLDCVDASLFQVSLPARRTHRTASRLSDYDRQDRQRFPFRIADEIGKYDITEIDAAEGALRRWLELD